MEKYSFSKLSCVDQCVMNYILSYICKSPQRQNAFAQYGSLVHSIMERYNLNQLQEWELVDEFVNTHEELITERFPSGKMKDTYIKQAIEYLSGIEKLEDYEILGVEEYFEVQVGDYVIRGIIDLILRRKSDGAIIIRDYKSKKDFKSPEEEAHYRRQLYLNNLHIVSAYGRNCDATEFEHFRTGVISHKAFDQDAYHEALVWAQSQVEKIRQIQSGYDKFFCSSLCGHRDDCALKNMHEGDNSPEPVESAE